MSPVRRLALASACAVLVPAAWFAPTALAQQNVVGGCVPASDPPQGDSDTNWSVRVCDVPDFDQVREEAAAVGQPTAITVAKLPGNGGCHCVLTTVADLYARAQVPLTGTDDFVEFAWDGRGALAAPNVGGTYDTTTYTAAEVTAYAGTTTFLQGLGDIAKVQYGQTAGREKECGTSYGAVYGSLPAVAKQFGESADDYAFSESNVTPNSAADMARALFGGAGVGIAYGYYDATAGADGKPDTASKRNGGHANALVGVTRSGDSYTFETSDPAASNEPAGADSLRQSAFARTTWAATERKLKLGDGTETRYNLGGTSRYLETWIQFGTTTFAARLRDRAKIRVVQLLPDLKRPPRPDRKPDPVDFTFPGPVLDATFDMTTSRLLAIVTVRGRPALYAGDAIGGGVRRVTASLPTGADRLASLPSGSIGVLGSGAVRVLARTGRTTATKTIAGGAADLAFNGATGGLLVLRADGRRLLKYSSSLKPTGGRTVTLPAGAGSAAATGRLTVSATGATRLSRVPAGTKSVAQALATPSGARLVLRDGRATLLTAAGSAVPGRSVSGLGGATLLDVSAGTVTRTPPAGRKLTDIIDQPVAGLDGAPANAPGAPGQPTDPGGPSVGEIG